MGAGFYGSWSGCSGDHLLDSGSAVHEKDNDLGHGGAVGSSEPFDREVFGTCRGVPVAMSGNADPRLYDVIHVGNVLVGGHNFGDLVPFAEVVHKAHHGRYLHFRPGFSRVVGKINADGVGVRLPPVQG